MFGRKKKEAPTIPTPREASLQITVFRGRVTVTDQRGPVWSSRSHDMSDAWMAMTLLEAATHAAERIRRGKVR